MGLCVLVFPQRDFGTNPSGTKGPQQSKQRFMSLTFGPTKCSGVVIAHIYELWVDRLKNTKHCFCRSNCDWMIGLQLPCVPRCYKNTVCRLILVSYLMEKYIKNIISMCISRSVTVVCVGLAGLRRILFVRRAMMSLRLMLSREFL